MDWPQPSFLLPFDNAPSNIPIEQNEILVHRPRGVQSRRRDPLLQLGDKFNIFAAMGVWFSSLLKNSDNRG